MHPIRSSYSVEFWDCGEGPTKGHIHKTKKSANLCIGNRSKKAEKQSTLDASETARRQRLLRNLSIFEGVVSGKAFSSVAKDCGVSRYTAASAFREVSRRARSYAYSQQNNYDWEFFFDLKSLRSNPDQAISTARSAVERSIEVHGGRFISEGQSNE